MVMEITYCFHIKVEKDGRKTPTLRVEKPHAALSALPVGTMGKYEGVVSELGQLNEVIAGKKDLHTITDPPCCIIDVRKVNALVTSGFDEFQPFIVPTSELIRLVEEWRDFLWHYETGHIPGLIPPPEVL